MFITQASSINFDIAIFQTDNTFNVWIKTCINKKEAKIIKAKFNIKSQIILETCALGDLNDYHIIIEAESIIVMQKNQIEKLVFINIRDNAKIQ